MAFILFPKIFCSSCFSFFFPLRKGTKWLKTQNRILFIFLPGFIVCAWQLRLLAEALKGIRHCRKLQKQREKCCSGGGNVGDRPILWISAVSNRCQPAPIKEESTSLKHCSFIRPQLCAALMVIIASKVAPQFSRDPIWKLSQLNLWVWRWMSLISDLIFNYLLTHRSTIFIMTCRERSFTSSCMSRQSPKRSAPVREKNSGLRSGKWKFDLSACMSTVRVARAATRVMMCDRSQSEESISCYCSSQI